MNERRSIPKGDYRIPLKLDFRHSAEVALKRKCLEKESAAFLDKLRSCGGLITKKAGASNAIDAECKILCDVLNRLPNTETVESCCGHRKDDYRIWFRCSDVEVLAFLARILSNNYWGFERLKDKNGNFYEGWSIRVVWTDVNPPAYLLTSHYYDGIFEDSALMAGIILKEFGNFYYSTFEKCQYEEIKQ